jgi:hypothetical protein
MASGQLLVVTASQRVPSEYVLRAWILPIRAAVASCMRLQHGFSASQSTYAVYLVPLANYTGVPQDGGLCRCVVDSLRTLPPILHHV